MLKVALDEVSGGRKEVIGNTVGIKPFPLYPVIGQQNFGFAVNLGYRTNTNKMIAERIISVHADNCVARYIAIL